MTRLLYRIRFCICCAISLFFSNGYAQQTGTTSIAENNSPKKIVAEVKPLKIGDKVPDIVFDRILNYKNRKAQLSDFKGKLVILDFWATWCGSCIEGFPKVEKLQKKFDKNVQFILVNSFIATHDNEKKVTDFFGKWKNKYGKTFSVPCAIDDVKAAQLFAHAQLPHYAWINQYGIVTAMTSSFEISEENIQRAIANDGFRAKEKIDFLNNRPIYLGEDFKLDSISSYSVFLKGRLNGVLPINEPRWGNNKSGEVCIRGWAARNAPLLDLFKFASRCHAENNKYNLQKRFVLEVNDTRELIFDPARSNNESWDRDNLYTYDLVIPADKTDSLFHFMTSQLNYFTKYNAALKKRTVKSWIIIVKDSAKVFGTRVEPIEKKSGKEFIDLSILTGKVNRSPQFEFPLFDESNFPGKIYVDLDADLESIDSLKQTLSVYGLDVIEGLREMILYVITDK